MEFSKALGAPGSLDMEEALSAIRTWAIDTFSHKYRIPVVLYDLHEDREVITPASASMFSDYCRVWRETPEGLALCRSDHRKRARRLPLENPHLCHAGLANCAIALEVDGSFAATLLCGQFNLPDSFGEEAIIVRNKALQQLPTTRARRTQLEALFDVAPSFTEDNVRQAIQDLENLCGLCNTLGRHSRAVRLEQEHYMSSVEKNSHEMKQRLQALLAEAEILELDASQLSAAKGGSTVVQAFVARASEVRHATQRMKVVVENMDGGDYLGAPRFKPCDIYGIIREVVRTYEAEAQRRRVTIDAANVQRCTLQLSRDHVFNTLANMVQNAVKYSYRGRPGEAMAVRISGQVIERAYRIVISNIGVGILPSEIEAIFEKSYRGELTHDEYRTGSGMGLPTALSLVRQHGGWITVRSRPFGRSKFGPYHTVFSVLFPIHDHRKQGLLL